MKASVKPVTNAKEFTNKTRKTTNWTLQSPYLILQNFILKEAKYKQ